MSEVINEVRKGFYLDSVALMRLSAEIVALGGIDDAVLMIGTPANLQIMKDAGILNDTGAAASPNDLVIALRADGKSSANRALAQAQKSLEGGALKSSASDLQSRTLRGALSSHSGANLALISTPGTYAGREARQALELGLNVMVFSDNVSLAQETSLKLQAREQGLLVMGPDCGTAYINGVPLAFANAVATGSTGVIAASGTGLQEFSVLLSKLGGGIRHGIGVGGRDLSDAIGAISTLTAIDLLAADDDVRQIVLISKPPGQTTAKLVFDKLATCGKPVIACVFGADESSLPAGIQHAATLRQAAELAAGKTLVTDNPKPSVEALIAGMGEGRRRTIGLYTGGTLCTEAMLVMRQQGLTVCSNTSADGDDTDAQHRLLDLGADEYTVGRPHPMIEPAVRTPLLSEAITSADTAVVLLDLVLGFGAHDNPAASIVEAIEEAQAGAQNTADGPLLIASICGTDDDPQGFRQQRAALRSAGVVICDSNSDAAGLAAQIAQKIG